MIKIIVAQRGWVVVGHFERSGNHVILTKGAVIRRWGTTHGLGHIAAHGPTAETVLDPIKLPFECLELTVVGMFACDEAAWAGPLEELMSV